MREPFGRRNRVRVYFTWKLVHLCSAILSFSGFVLRGYWMMTDPVLLGRKWVRILPHVVDTVFLLSGIALVLVLGLHLLESPWLLAKLAALVVYVLAGAIALRRGRSPAARTVAFTLAVLTFAYIVGVAITKSTLSWLAA